MLLEPETELASQPSQTVFKTLQQVLEEDLKAVDKVILETVSGFTDLIPRIVSYLIESGGKRLRPSLALLVAKMFGYEGARKYPLASAVEFIHTATLLHDDVVDESLLRRGQPSANVTFGNKPSILVGDFLLAQSLQLMIKDGDPKILAIFGNTASILTEGEIIQLEKLHDISLSEADYLKIIHAKTAELFSSSCHIGAVLGSTNAHDHKALACYGYHFGIAFQIVDDALDYVASEKDLGKAVGDDFREGKMTLPVIHAYSKATKEEKAFFERCIAHRFQEDGDLDKAIAILNTYGSIDYCLGMANEHAAKAEASLEQFKQLQYCSLLIDLLDFCVNRAY